MSEPTVTLEIVVWKKGHITAERRRKFIRTTREEVDAAAAEASVNEEWLAKALASPESFLPERRVEKTYR